MTRSTTFDEILARATYFANELVALGNRQPVGLEPTTQAAIVEARIFLRHQAAIKSALATERSTNPRTKNKAVEAGERVKRLLRTI